MTRHRVSKSTLLCNPMLMYLHNKQIAAPNQIQISDLLNHISLRMDCILCISTTLGSRTQTITRNLQNLTPRYDHCHMKTRLFCLAHPHGIGILQKTFQQRVITLLDWARHLGGVYDLSSEVRFQIFVRVDAPYTHSLLDYILSVWSYLQSDNHTL